MVALKNLIVIALIASLFSARLLTEEPTEKQAEGEENPQDSEHHVDDSTVEQKTDGSNQEGKEVKDETPVGDDKTEPTDAEIKDAKKEDHIEDTSIEKNEQKEKPADTKQEESKTTPPPSKSGKARIFIGVGVVLLGLGFIGAAYFLKKSSSSWYKIKLVLIL